MAKLTKEEKKALKEAKKLEKARKKEEARRQLLMESLGRELNFTTRSERLLKQRFRNELERLKLTEYHDNVQTAWKQFNRALDCKNFEISVKLEELDEASEQHLTAYQGHCEQVDKYLQLMRTRVGLVREQYLYDLNTLNTMATRILNGIKDRQFNYEEYFRQMIYQLDCDNKEYMKQWATEHQNKMDLEDNKFLESLQVARIYMEKTLEENWAAYQRTLEAYYERSSERKKEYDKLVRNDNKNVAKINKQMDRIASLHETIKRLRERTLSVRDEQNIKLSDLRKERQVFSDAFWTMRNALKHDKMTGTNHLHELADISNGVIEHLKQLRHKGEMILKMASLCLHLERQQEKVMPFRYYYQIPDRVRESLNRKSRASTLLSPQNLIECDQAEDVELDKFWLHLGYADSERCAINEEREFLRRQNTFIQNKLKHYYDTATYINPYAPKPQPRFVYEKHKYKLGPINAIEASHNLQNYNQTL